MRHRSAFCLACSLIFGIGARAEDTAQSAREQPIRKVIGKTERATHTAPFLDAVEVELGEGKFKLGPVVGDSLNTLTVTRGTQSSLSVGAKGVSRLSILHTAVRLHGVADCRIETNYEETDQPEVRTWRVHDWQARTGNEQEKAVASGVWWYRQDKGLVITDTNARVYDQQVEVDPTKRIESIVLMMPEHPRAELRVYAVSVLDAKERTWRAVDLSKHFNADTILSEAKKPAGDGVYFALQEARDLNRTQRGKIIGLDPKVEILRTKPDYILYDPADGKAPPWQDPDFFWLNEHILVQPNGKGELLAMWTSERLKPWKWSVMYAHSNDNGETWSKATVLDGPKAAWQVPIICPRTGRIYVLMTHGFTHGGLRCYTSDDGGHTWSDPVELDFPKTAVDHPKKKAAWISPTVPHWNSQGRPLLGYTRWATHPMYPTGIGGHSQIEFVRIENLDESPEPKDLKFTWLNIDNPITVPHKAKPGFSYAEEPYTVLLPDGRLFVVIRTDSGKMWYSVSEDEGESWRQAEPLRYRDGGDFILHPVTPGPIFRLARGDYVLLYNNNDGTGNGWKGVEDRAARRPAYLARGEFRPDAHQPIWFSQPKLFIDNDNVPWGPPGRERLEAATYTSLTDIDGKRILWYPDRKSMLLGKLISDDFLADMKVQE